MENENINQQLEQGAISKKFRGVFTKKLLLITGIVVAILIIFLTAFTLLSAPKKQTPDTNIPTSTPSASLAFLSDTLELTEQPTDEITTDFIVDTNTIPVKGFLLYLEYDPQYIEIKKFNLNNTESSFFGFYAQLVQLGLGEPPYKTTVSIVLPEEEIPKSGRGSIGSFTFEVKNLNPGDSTSINISSDSSFITSDGSIIPYVARPLFIVFLPDQNSSPDLAPDAQQRLIQQQQLLQ